MNSTVRRQEKHVTTMKDNERTCAPSSKNLKISLSVPATGA